MSLPIATRVPWTWSIRSASWHANNRCWDWIDQQHPSLSAVIVEPAVGARGYIAPPNEYWQSLREVTQRYGVLLIADEIQMGLGRTGHWLLSRYQGWQADLIVLGKSLGGGIVPLSAVIGPQQLVDDLPAGSESETFAASPLAMAIGSEVLNQLATGPWLNRAHDLGTALASTVKASMPDKHVEVLGARSASTSSIARSNSARPSPKRALGLSPCCTQA